jgi:tetratricopeptide (TPR) repeat protein
MRNFDEVFQEMDPDKIFDRVEELETELQPDEKKEFPEEEIEGLFELLHGLAATGNHERAAMIFHVLRDAVLDFRSREGIDQEKGLRYLIEWSLLALRFTPEERNSFVCMPIYDDLFAAIETGPESLRFQAVRAQLQLIRHYEFWQGKGGKINKLPEEDREKLENASETFPDAIEAARDDEEEKENWNTLIRLNRYAISFYLGQKQPNEAIRCIKSSLEHLPQSEDYHPADSGDLLLQLGSLFMEYKKWDAAIRYFEQAHQIYEEGGEDLEMFKFQAEGWIEEATKRKKMYG